MQKLEIEVKTELPKDFCMKNRGLFLRTKRIPVWKDEMYKECLLPITAIGVLCATLVSASMYIISGLWSALLGAVVTFLIIFLFCTCVFYFSSCMSARKERKLILNASNEKECRKIMTRVADFEFPEILFPDAFLSPFGVALHNLMVYKQLDGKSFKCKRIAVNMNGMCYVTVPLFDHFIVSRIEIRNENENPMISIREDETVLWLTQQQYDKL